MRLRRNSKLIGFMFMFCAFAVLSTIYRVLPRIKIKIAGSPVMSPGYIVSQRNNKLPLFSMIFAESGPQETVPIPINFSASFKHKRPRSRVGSLKVVQTHENSTFSNMLNVHIWDEICGDQLANLKHHPLFPEMPSRRRLIDSLNIKNYGVQYGVRIFGYLKISQSGTFRFRLDTGEGEVEVWIGVHGTPSKAVLICTNKRPLGEVIVSSNVIYLEILIKQGLKTTSRILKWMPPGTSSFRDINTRHMIPYFDDRGYTGKDVILEYKVPPKLPMHLKDPILATHNTVENKRRSSMYRLPYILDKDVVNLFSYCKYEPSYIVRTKLQRYQGVWETHYSSIFPSDGSNMTYFLRNGQQQMIFGNDVLDESTAKQIVNLVMEAFEKHLPGKYELVNILNVEENKDVNKGSRFLVEIELRVSKTGEHFRFSEYVIQPLDRPNFLCYPKDFRWNKTATVNFILTVGNQGRWAKHFIDTISAIYDETRDQNINVIIVDFDSHDLDLFEALEQSSIPRYTLLRKFGKFYKSEAIQQAANTILDPNSIVLQVDLHLTMPLDLVDNVRKHCVIGKMAYSPCVTRLVCGAYLEKPIGFWEVVGYGIFGIYKEDWDIFGGMNIAEFRNRWGGEDWEMLDRVMMAGYEVERLKMLHFNHIFHTKKGMWEEMN